MLNEAAENAVKAEGETTARHILLVDDDLSYLKMVRGWLSEKYQVTAVKTGSQALAYLEAHTADIILLDFEMPDMNGPQVFERIRQKPQAAGIPVVFLTGRSDEETIRRVMEQSATGYLLKSMDRNSIVKAIDGFFSSGIFSAETEEQI